MTDDICMTKERREGMDAFLAVRVPDLRKFPRYP